MKALITGASGFIGRALLERLPDAHVLTRRPAEFQATGAHRAFEWRSAAEAPDPRAFDGVEAVIHLAGESVAQRWTPAAKERILSSRVLGTGAIVEALAHATPRPRVLVSASAVGYYGDRGDDLLAEAEPPGSDFLAQVCVAWEQAAAWASALGVRVVCVRIGLVLGAGGGALAKMLPAFRLGLGGPLGTGRQWMSWIHVQDLAALILHLAEKPDAAGAYSGAYNAAAPEAVRNAEFTRALGRALHRPAFLRAPAFALRTVLGEMSSALLASTRVSSARAERTGFRFRYPDLPSALVAIASSA